MFRRHRIVKGRKRDRAWFSLLDRDWREAKGRLEEFLSSLAWAHRQPWRPEEAIAIFREVYILPDAAHRSRPSSRRN